MLLKPHPSARHSGVDWSDRHTVIKHSSTPQPQQPCLTCFPHPSLLPPQPSTRYDSTPRVADARFDNAAALQVPYYEQAGTPHLCSTHDTPPAPPSRLQVIVHAGETLYVPSYWTHFIVSLDTSFQCNCRSGQTSAGLKHVAECGFVGPTIIDPDMYVLVEWALQPNRAMPMLLTHSHSHTHHCTAAGPLSVASRLTRFAPKCSEHQRHGIQPQMVVATQHHHRRQRRIRHPRCRLRLCRLHSA